jgi:glutamate---cysteine ligase / carboxylate-amine ligase
LNRHTFDPSKAREVFESSTDFTVGLEEEFGLLDPDTLSLVNRFEELYEAASRDELLADSVAGELIASEIEIRSGRGDDFADAIERQRARRRRLFAVAADLGMSLGATGLHPWSRWQDQRIIDTPHYRLVEESLKYVAWRNNTFSVHAHVGVNGPDRAVAVCDALRPVLPVLLAASANSAFAEGVFSGLHSTRSEIFTRMFPRCGVPDHFGGFDAYVDYVDVLFRVNSIVEHTQIWWSVRPHLAFGTVELRIMDAQGRAEESTALLALATACIAQAALDYDLGRRPDPVPPRLIEENFWRAIRYGLDGNLIDFERMAEIPARAVVEGLLEWTEGARSELRLDQHLDPIEQMLESGNGAQRQWRRHEAGDDERQIYADIVSETCVSYAETPMGVGACGGGRTV